MRRLSILTFHAIEPVRSVLSYPPNALLEGLRRLTDSGFRALDLVATTALGGDQALPSRSFVITFDDGYRSVYQQAFPLLRELDLTATVFVATGDGRGERPPSLSGREMLAWREIDEMARNGFSIGAHSLTHPDLTTLPRERVRKEMEESRAVLEDRLGVAVRSFAYPFGRYDETSRQVASELFDCACSDRLGRVGRGTDRFALPRVESFYLRGARRLAFVGSPLFGLVLALFAGPRRLRRAMRSWSTAARRRG